MEPPRNFIESLNPLARILALVSFSSPLLVTIDWLSALVALVLEILALAAGGLSFRYLLRRAWLILIFAPISGLSMLLYAKPEGTTVYFRWAFIAISDNSILLAISTVVRVLALAMPAVALFLHTDPTRVADALAQNGRLSPRFVLATLSAVRMTGQLMADWKTMELARRARGLSDSGRVRRFRQISFGLLVLALRRAADLATAMEARGFDSPTPRSWARPSLWRGRDTFAVLLALSISAVALSAAVWAGTFRWFGL